MIRTRLLSGIALVVLGSCGPIEPEARPVLRICDDPRCLDQPTSPEEWCAPLNHVDPSEGFYAFHVIHDQIVLEDDVRGELVIETICGQTSFPLTYSSPTKGTLGRIAGIPLAAPDEILCGMTVRATLLNQTASCYRNLGLAHSSMSTTSESPDAEGSGGLATRCAKLRDSCPAADTDAAQDTSDASESSMGGSEGSTGDVLSSSDSTAEAESTSSPGASNETT